MPDVNVPLFFLLVAKMEHYYLDMQE